MQRLTQNRSFHGHIGAQFFGAFNDNLFKQLILFLAARELFPGEDKQGLAFAVFALPFILFSSYAGDLSERLSKQKVVVAMKVAEIFIMGAGVYVLQSRSWALMLVVLFVMGAQSAFFGPAKYGVIPELVKKDQLMAANGVISMTTFLAILLGQALAGPLLDSYGDALWVTGVWCTGFAAIGTGLSLMIRKLQPQRPSLTIQKNPFGGVWSSIVELREDPRVFKVLVLNSLFWFDSGVAGQAITGLSAPKYLNIPADQNWRISLLLVILALSIIIGSVCVPFISRTIRPGRLVALGAVVMMGAQWLLAAVTAAFGGSELGYDLAAGTLVLIGFFGAFFAVPIQTFLQDAPLEGTRGKAFAVNNFLNFIFIFLAGIFYLGSSAISLQPGIAAGIAGLILCAALYRNRVAVLSIERPHSEA